MSDLAVDGFGHWLAGFIDGEGSFMILAYRDPRGRQRYRLRFRLAVRDDDFSALDEILERTGIGEIVHTSRPAPWGDVASWQVRRQSDLEALCGVLDRYPLRAKKQADYEVWREAVVTAARIYRGGDRRRVDANESVWSRLSELRDLLREIRAYPFKEDALV